MTKKTKTNLIVNYYELDYVERDKYCVNFIDNYVANECCSNIVRLAISDSFSNLVDISVNALKAHAIDSRTICHTSRIVSISSKNILISITDYNNEHSDFWTVYNRNVTIRGFGDRQILQKIFQYFKSNIQERKIPTVSWEFLVGEDRRSQEIEIEQAKPIHDEFYPWIEGGVFPYIDSYLASESSILVLLGLAGSGKTSLIRSMIWYASLNTMFTYEDELLKSDSFFVDFIVNDQMHLLIVEDADLFLTSREHDGNKIMSKFLNVSDGLPNIGRKKIIFTANIMEPAKIDSALLRAGRCFDCQVFRPLTFEEACAAAQVADITQPEANKSYTLAELFASNKAEQRSAFVNKFGFGR